MEAEADDLMVASFGTQARSKVRRAFADWRREATQLGGHAALRVDLLPLLGWLADMPKLHELVGTLKLHNLEVRHVKNAGNGDLTPRDRGSWSRNRYTRQFVRSVGTRSRASVRWVGARDWA